MSDEDYSEDDNSSENDENSSDAWLADLNRMLEMLSRDDATEIRFLLTEDYRPESISELDGRIKDIGAALKGKKRVRTLELEFPEMLGNEFDAYSGHGSNKAAHSGLLEFVRNSESLRSFQFRDECEIYEDDAPITNSYISAVKDNPNIIHFRLEFFRKELVPALCELLKTNRTIEFLELQGAEDLARPELEDVIDNVLNRQEVNELCMALGANKALKSVTFDHISFLWEGNGARDVALLKDRPQNKLVTELIFEGCLEVDEESAANILHTFPSLEKLTTNSLSPFMAYFDLPEDQYEREYRPLSIQEFMFVGDISKERGMPKMKEFIASQPKLKKLNCAFIEKVSNRKGLNIVKSIIEGISEQETSAMKSLFLDNLIIPKSIMDKSLNKLVHGLDEMEFHFAFAGKLPVKAKNWLSRHQCALKLLRLNLLSLNNFALVGLFTALSQNKSIETLQVKNLEDSKLSLSPLLRDCVSKMKQLKKVTTTSALLIRAVCETNPNSIEELEIERPNLGRDGVLEALAIFLSRHDCKLKRLTVSDIETEACGEDALENPNLKEQIKLVNALSCNNSLEYLCLNGLEPSIPLFNLAVVLPSLKTLKEIYIAISQVWEVEPTTLFALKTALLCGLKQNTSLTGFHCDLDDESYSFQKETVVHCLRNKVLSFALGEDVEIPMEILHHSAEFLL